MFVLVHIFPLFLHITSSTSPIINKSTIIFPLTSKRTTMTKYSMFLTNGNVTPRGRETFLNFMLWKIKQITLVQLITWTPCTFFKQPTLIASVLQTFVLLLAHMYLNFSLLFPRFYHLSKWCWDYFIVGFRSARAVKEDG